MKIHRWLLFCWLVSLSSISFPRLAGAVEPKLDASVADTNVMPVTGEGFKKRAQAFRLKGDAARATADFSEAIRLNPNDAEYYDGRAWLYVEAKEFDKAMEDCNTAIRLDPKYADAYFLRALINMARKNPDAVMADCDAVIRLNPNKIEAYNMRAMIFMGTGDSENALKNFDEMVRIDPKSAVGHAGRTSMLIMQKKMEPALKAANEALLLDPKNANVHEMRAYIFSEMGDYVPALRDFSQAVEDDPENVGYITMLAWKLATVPDDKCRDGARARQLATHACSLTDWKDGNSLTAIAAAEAELGNFKSAIKYQTDAIEARKNDGQAIVNKLQKNLALYESGKPCRDGKTKEENAVAK